MKITIESKKDSSWMYFWIKTIESINIENHCAKTFVGKYLKGNEIETDIKDVYICGVSKPFSYNNNLHIALKYKEGSNITINEKDVLITVQNAERIEIKALKRGEINGANGLKKDFYTCRNWQYSNQLLTDK